MPLVDDGLTGARILIVDDEEPNIRVLERILAQSGYQLVESTTSPRTVGSLCAQWKPDLILLDLQMPDLDGIGVLRELRPLIPADSYLPILILTGDQSPDAKRKALSSGATDFLTKPFDMTEVLLRIRNLLEARSLHLRLQNHNQLLESRVRERTRALEKAQHEILDRLAGAGEFRDDETGQHTHRVGTMSAALARALGADARAVHLIGRAAPLHDLGKIGIPDRVLLKPGPFTAEDAAIMRTHTTIGAEILSGGESELILMAEQIALSHHERWDGTGYPERRAGTDIPWPARVVSVADVFDALSHDRPYRPAWPLDAVIREIEKVAGSQLDPEMAGRFLSSCVKDYTETLNLPPWRREGRRG
ncbi:MAG: HD domain-containing phosphohydrolase [Gemmatimonadales bacterium]